MRRRPRSMPERECPLAVPRTSKRTSPVTSPPASQPVKRRDHGAAGLEELPPRAIEVIERHPATGQEHDGGQRQAEDDGFAAKPLAVGKAQADSSTKVATI